MNHRKEFRGELFILSPRSVMISKMPVFLNDHNQRIYSILLINFINIE